MTQGSKKEENTVELKKPGKVNSHQNDKMKEIIAGLVIGASLYAAGEKVAVTEASPAETNPNVQPFAAQTCSGPEVNLSQIPVWEAALASLNQTLAPKEIRGAKAPKDPNKFKPQV